MITRRTRNLLSFFLDSVEVEKEPLDQAQKFLMQLPELSEEERFLLDQALQSRARLKQFNSIFGRR